MAETYSPSYDTLKNTTNVPQHAQRHLVHVYSALSASMAVSALGAYAQVNNLFIIQAGFLTMLATVAALVGIIMMPYNGRNQYIRWGLLWCYTFFQGISLGSVVDWVAHIQGSSMTVLVALVATFFIFTSFTLCALLTTRRSYLYLGGFISSAISVVTWVSVANLFLGWRTLFNLELYLGLLAFCGYVIYDTQAIVEKATLGDYDVVGHTVELFADMVSLFLRVLSILLNKQVETKSEEERKERRRRR